MAMALEGAFVRTTLGCIVLVMASCHGASREPGVSSALGGEAPTVVVTVASADAGVMENDFADEGEMQDEDGTIVVTMRPPRLDEASADREALEDCKAWSLTNEEAEAFFAMSRPVDAHAWNEGHDAPCAITGTVHGSGMDWQFSINGANKAMWQSGESVRYLSCDSRECEQFSS